MPHRNTWQQHARNAASHTVHEGLRCKFAFVYALEWL